jgi:hypothetical protein
MGCGADISKPGQSGKDSSVASLVASMNSQLTSWGSTISLQSPKKNIILNVKPMMVELLKSFKKINNRLPTSLLGLKVRESQS